VLFIFISSTGLSTDASSRERIVVFAFLVRRQLQGQVSEKSTPYFPHTTRNTSFAR